jgi:hypothetical protein
MPSQARLPRAGALRFWMAQDDDGALVSPAIFLAIEKTPREQTWI